MKQKSKVDILNQKISDLSNEIKTLTKRKNQELKQSEEKFKILFEKSKRPKFIIDGYKIIECNKAAQKKLKETGIENILGKDLGKISNLSDTIGKDTYKDIIDLAYKKGYHRFEWEISRNLKETFLDIELTKIPYKNRETILAIWHDISQHKRFEKNYLSREKQFAALFEQAADGFLVGIGNGEIIEANKSICKLTGYKKSELIGSNISILFEKTELKGTPLRYDLVKKGLTVIRERNIVKKDGTIVPVEMNTKILGDGRMQALFRDITRRKKTEKELLINKELLQKSEKIAGLGNYFYDIKKDTWQSSEALNAIFGIEASQKRNFKLWQKIIHPDFKDEMLRYFNENILQNHEQFDKEYKIIRINNNEERWVHGYGELELDKDNNPLSIFGIIQDITENKIAELELRRSEEKYRKMFHNAPLGIFHYDLNGVITDFNQRFIEIIGSSKEALLGLKMFSQLQNKKLVEIIKKSLVNGEGYYEDWYSSVTAEKNTFVRILLKGLTDINGKIISGIGLVEDISERKKAEKDLKISEEKYKSLVTLLPEVIYETDIYGNFKFVNLRAFEIFEYTYEDFKKGLNILQMLAPEEIERAKHALNSIDKNTTANGRKYMAITKTGKKFPILVYLDFVRQDNEIVGFRGIIVNISELQKAQEKLIKSEEKYRLLIENLQDAIVLVEDSEIIDCNLKTNEMFGYTAKDEIIGKSIFDFSPRYQPDGSVSKSKLVKIINSNQTRNINTTEWLHKKNDGTTFYTEITAILFEIENKRLIQFTIRDISERKEVEQKILNAVIETEEKERERLASDLHDEIGPLLSSLKMYIESLDTQNVGDKQKFIKEKLQNLIVDSINNIREVSNALSPYLLNRYGLYIAIKSFIGNSKELINIQFSSNLMEARFTSKVEMVYYRIIKELINNTIKHAKAQNIKIILEIIYDELVLHYSDDGIGFSEETITKLEIKGMGLYNIINRIKSINGRYRFYSVTPHGFGFELITKI